MNIRANRPGLLRLALPPTGENGASVVIGQFQSTPSLARFKVSTKKVKPVKTFLSTREYAEARGLSVQQVTQMLRGGQIAGEKVGGRWRIASDRLSAGLAPEPMPTSNGTDPPGSPYFTVDEFAAMTYLTPWGVVDWLKTGRLQRVLDADGNWVVDAGCLENPDVRRILR